MIAKTVTAILLISTASCAAAEKITLKDKNDKINYSTGYQLGNDFKRQGIQLSSELLLQGVLDASAGSHALMTTQEMKIALMNLQKKVAQSQQKKTAALARGNRLNGKQFLADNATRDGVKTRASGLQYRVITPGTGKKPQKDDRVTLRYRGTLLDGTEFDNSSHRDKAAIFKVDQVIRGWTEALQLMSEGAHWELFIPPQLGFGDRTTGIGIPPDSTLIYDMELIAID